MNKPPATPRYSQEQAVTMIATDIKGRMADSVISLLFEEALDALGQELREIAIENTKCTNTGYLSFLYKGKFFNLEDTVADDPVDLDSSLHGRMDDYLNEMKQIVEYEVPVVRGILKSLFIASDRISDYKKVLPEQIHSAFDYFSDTAAKRVLMPAEIDRMKKRIAPFLTIMKARMLHNHIVGRGQP